MSLALVLAGCERTPPNDTGESDTDTDTDSDTDTDTDSDTEVTDCTTLPGGLPAWTGRIDPTLVTNTPYSNTGTGLAAVVAEIASYPNNEANENVAVSPPIAVSGVTVINTGRQPSGVTGDDQVNVWVADGEGVLYLRLSASLPIEVQPGDSIDFTVTQITNYFGDYQVAALTGFSVNSPDNDVYVRESSGAAFGAGDFFYTHHVFGELATAPTDCGGGRVCFDFVHGSPVTSTTEFRIQNANLTIPLIQGDCVELYAPLDQFSGSGTFDIEEFDWHRWYGNTGG